MGWYIGEVRDECGDIGGYCIVDTVCGAVVRPFPDHPQSVFPGELCRAIAEKLTELYGDPRAGTLDNDTWLKILREHGEQ